MTERWMRDSITALKIEKGLKGTTTGLTLEKSYLEDYLRAVCMLFKVLTDIEINIGGNENAETD